MAVAIVKGHVVFGWRLPYLHTFVETNDLSSSSCIFGVDGTPAADVADSSGFNAYNRLAEEPSDCKNSA